MKNTRAAQEKENIMIYSFSTRHKLKALLLLLLFQNIFFSVLFLLVSSHLNRSLSTAVVTLAYLWKLSVLAFSISCNIKDLLCVILYTGYTEKGSRESPTINNHNCSWWNIPENECYSKEIVSLNIHWLNCFRFHCKEFSQNKSSQIISNLIHLWWNIPRILFNFVLIFDMQNWKRMLFETWTGKFWVDWKLFMIHVNLMLQKNHLRLVCCKSYWIMNCYYNVLQFGVCADFGGRIVKKGHQSLPATEGFSSRASIIMSKFTCCIICGQNLIHLVNLSMVVFFFSFLGSSLPSLLAQTPFWCHLPC